MLIAVRDMHPQSSAAGKGGAFKMQHASRSICRFALFLAVIGLAAARPAAADVRLPHVFGSHMVLQRDCPLPVWGWAEPGEAVSVKVDDRAAVTATADARGAWRVTLPAMPAGGPHTLTVAGRNTIKLEDVLVGEVWVCSGQSNMEFTLGGADKAQEEIAAAQWPLIRHIGIPKVTGSVPQEDVNAEWKVCTPQTAGGFTAVGYFFGRELHRQLKVPVGLIHTSWGGTRIEPWTPPVGFGMVPALEGIYKQVALADPHSAEYKAKLGGYLDGADAWLKKARASLAAESSVEPLPAFPQELAQLRDCQQPTTLYNAMVHPLVPFAIRGAIWYQGESNHGEGRLYTEKMKALVEGWRRVWNLGPFPFYYVQIAPFQYGEEDPTILPVFWEAQEAAQAVITNSGMVVINDVGNIHDIHPKNKQEVGRRLALQALAKTYGQADVVCSGPVFQSLTPDGNRLRVRFANAAGGLATRDGQPPSGFEIVGLDTDFVKAEAVIEGDSVVLTSSQVPAPAAVRYAWHKLAEPNLMNKAGLPAVPFRAGKVPERDWLALKVPEAKDYRLVYALDLAKLGHDVTYDEDARAQVTGPFDRIAYFLELQKHGEPVRYAYVSMDAFTKDLSKIGVPTLASKAVFQQTVSNLVVISNMPGVTECAGKASGNLEFWPHNYGPINDARVAGASNDLWDFGDQRADPEDGYGSMQVHNVDARQTIFAINHWVGGGGGADIGIGNSEGKTRDWTFAANAGQYTVKKLRVLVRPAR